jgi:dehydrogenase/reductase SDR family protein 1
VASTYAARIMVPQRRGLIVNVSSIGAIKYTGNVSYNVVKAAVDMLTLGAAEELRRHGVAVVSIWPRFTRTEAVLAHPELYPDVSTAWSPLFNGRAVAALAADAAIIEKSGQALDIGAIANEYGFTDLDGRRPVPLQ